MFLSRIFTILHIFFFLGLTLSIITVKAQDPILKKRIYAFYKIQENKQLSKEDKIKQLKEFIIPGNTNDSMAVFFYNSWLKFSKQAKSLKTKIIDIQYIENGSKAIVTTEDYVEYLDGDKNTFKNKALWIKLNEIWYREDKKSQLFKDGEKIRE